MRNGTHLWVDEDPLDVVLLVPDGLSQGGHVVLPHSDLQSAGILTAGVFACRSFDLIESGKNGSN